MERLRVVFFARDRSPDGAVRVVPIDKYVIAGQDPAIEDLPSLSPDVVFIADADFAAGKATAERVLRRLPSVSVVMTAGADVDAQEVLAAVRLGVRDVLTDPGVAEVHAALDRLWTVISRQREGAPEQAGKIVVVHSPKGGSGKSSLASNLAFVLESESGQESVLVDLALAGGDLDLLLNVKPSASWADLARCGAFGPEEIEAVLASCGHGVRLLAAPPNPEDAELVDTSVVERALGLLRDRFAYVVVDTPPALNETTLRAMELADRILLPLPLTLPALRRAQRGLKLWRQLGVDTASVLCIAWDQKGDLSVESAQKLLRQDVSHLLPYDPKAVEQALNNGEALAIAAPSGSYARAVRAISSAIKGHDGKGETRKANVWDWLNGKRRQAHVPA